MRKTLYKISPLLIAFVFVSILVVIFLPSFISHKKIDNIVNNASSSKDVFMGILEKKEANVLMMKGAFGSGLIQTPITYEILIDNNTKVAYNNPPIIPYLFKDPQPISSLKVTMNDVKIGQQLYAYGLFNSKENPPFYSNKIEIVSSPQTAVNGKITRVEKNIITLEGSPYPPQSFKERPSLSKYYATITGDTEISHLVPMSLKDLIKPPDKVELSFSALKKDMEVNVFTNVNVVSTNTFTAFRIEPVIPLEIQKTPLQRNIKNPIPPTSTSSPSSSLR